MDTNLYEATQSGNIDYLQQLLRENPVIINISALLATENPLHVASNMGHVDFVKEIIRLKPDFAKEISGEGFSPMHIAAANGHLEIVRELMNVDCKLCWLEGREKKTPLHYAAIKGRVEVISAMLLGCPDCIEAVTVQRETALHLAVKNNQFEAIKILVDWIRKVNKEDIFNMKDEQGNTVLHLATWKKQREVIELLLGNGNISPPSVLVNAMNHSGLTALDVLLLFPSEAGDREIIEILQGAGAMKARNITHTTNNQTSNTSTTPETCQSHNLVEYFKFKKGRDSPSDARSTLLVIAVLVATATFHVGVNPPGGTWPDTYITHQLNGTSNEEAHAAGESVWATTNEVAFILSVFFNSVGFFMSLYMIYVLTSRLPLQFELQICMLAMFSTYNTATVNLTPNKLRLYSILTTVILSLTLGIVVQSVRRLAKTIRQFVMDKIGAVL